MKNLVSYDNPALHKKAEIVKDINSNIHILISEMTEVMKKANGIGIAAPQVGESIQLAIVDVPKDMGGIGRMVLINPKILSAYGKEIGEEGCLSVPGMRVKVKRYKEVMVETLNMEGNPVIQKGTGLLARALQHEIDHLNGILIVDKVSPLKKALIKRKIKQMSKAIK